MDSKIIKELYHNLRYEDGKKRDVYTGKFAKIRAGKIEILQNFLDYLLEYSSKDYIYYISNVYMTIEGVRDKFGGKYNTLAKVMYGKKVLQDLFGEDFVIDVITERNELNKYQSLINRAYLLKAIKLNQTLDSEVSLGLDSTFKDKKYSEVQFDICLQQLKPYAKKHRDSFLANNRNLLCYMNSIYSVPNSILRKEDIERKRKIAKMLGEDSEIGKCIRSKLAKNKVK